MKTPERLGVKVADEVWIVAALLHQENPKRKDFSVDEIVKRAEREAIVDELRPGIRVHAIQHCVAGRPPDPARYCMLTETGKMTRRLWRPGDPVHPRRRGAKTAPVREEIPEKYQPLLDWYKQSQPAHLKRSLDTDPILSLRGRGKDIWKGIDADNYVRKLREGWK